MLLFVGKKEKGFFTEETGEKVEYIDEALHIKDQAEAILRFNDEATVVIYDIEQYADEAKELVHWINRIEDALKIKTIIFAAGYSPQSTVCRMLWDAGVKNFIFSIYLGDQKEDLEYCLTGYYENFGYKEKRGFSFEEEEEDIEEESGEKKKTRTIGIGVAGCIKRMGTTTQALQIVKYLQFIGRKAAYFQMNASNFVEAVKDAYEQVTVDEDIGLVSYANTDMYYRTDKLQEVLNLDYDYLIFDYGVAGENGFNKISFLEKERQIFVVGSKPGGEFEKTYDVIKNNFYNNVFYIYNFVTSGEQEDIKELMGEKAEVTFFAKEARDPFVFSGDMQTYGSILSLEDEKDRDNKPTKKKKRLFGKRR